MNDLSDIEYINEHRGFLGYPPFECLTDASISLHLDLILAHFPYGNDPWQQEPRHE